MISRENLLVQLARNEMMTSAEKHDESYNECVPLETGNLCGTNTSASCDKNDDFYNMLTMDNGDSLAEPSYQPSSDGNSSEDCEDVRQDNVVLIPSDVKNEVHPSRTRKRRRKQSLQHQRKQKRNSGETYTTNTGKIVAAKIFCSAPPCQCKLNCCSKITNDQRKTLFSNFWKIGNFNAQNALLCSQVRQKQPMVRRPRDASRPPKQTSNSYFFNIGDQSIKVCKKFFLTTLQISDGRMTRALQKFRNDEVPRNDNYRVSRSNNCDLKPPVKKTPTEESQKVSEPLPSFPTYNLRNSRETYTTKEETDVAAKIFYNEPCQCKRNCCSKITNEQRKTLFSNFWKIDDFKAQNALICGLVKQKQPQSRRPKDASRPPKQTSNSYFFNIGDQSIKVCKKYFLTTLQISDGRMTRALQKLRNDTVSRGHNRGSKPPINKTSHEDLEKVCEHIASFPAYRSHYKSNHHNGENTIYLSETLNIRLMYNLYCQQCQESNSKPVTEPIYRCTFNTKFDLRFNNPRKDTCIKCDQFKTKITTFTPKEKLHLEKEHREHLEMAEKARKSLKEDTEKSTNSNKVYCLTYDLQKPLLFPKLTCNISYYKRNMYFHNLGIYECSSGFGFMYTWDETTASRGSQEIASCLDKHINWKASGYRHIIIYSNSCTEQNCNIVKVALNLLRLVQDTNNNIEMIDHKFMISGHSFLPNEVHFGMIEMKAKRTVQYSPSDWSNVIATAPKKKPFHVTTMTRNDFFSTKNLERSVTVRKTNTLNQPVNWTKIQWLRYHREHPYTIFYKESLEDDEDFKSLSVKPARRPRPRMLTNAPLLLLYLNKRPVTEAKKKDMMDLLQYIPPIHHAYFEGLETSTEATEYGPEGDGDDDNHLEK